MREGRQRSGVFIKTGKQLVSYFTWPFIVILLRVYFQTFTRAISNLLLK